MEEKSKFGELNAVSLSVGDIVSWSKWNLMDKAWDEFIGVLLETRNEMKGRRLVSISRVMPLNSAGPLGELEFFTLSLRLVSPSNNKKK